MAKKKAARKSCEDVPFERCLEDLEAIVRRLEEGKGTLDDSLEDYQTAVKLLKTCHNKLDGAQQKIELLTGFDADGNPISRPFGDAEGDGDDLSAKAKKRSARRTSIVENDFDDNDFDDNDEPGLF